MGQRKAVYKVRPSLCRTESNAHPTRSRNEYK